MLLFFFHFAGKEDLQVERSYIYTLIIEHQSFVSSYKSYYMHYNLPERRVQNCWIHYYFIVFFLFYES